MCHFPSFHFFSLIQLPADKNTFSEENPFAISSQGVMMMMMMCLCAIGKPPGIPARFWVPISSHFYPLGNIRCDLCGSCVCTNGSIEVGFNSEENAHSKTWQSYFTTEQCENYHRHILQTSALRFGVEWLNCGLLQYCQAFSSENRMATCTFA